MNNIIKSIYEKTLLVKHKRILIKWAKLHIGTIGNERADSLTRSALENDEYDEELLITYPISLVKRYFRNKIINDWQIYWQTSEKGRDTYNDIKKSVLNIYVKIK